MTRSQSRTTWAAVALALGIAVPYLFIFIQSVRATIDPASVPQELLREMAMLGAGTEGADTGIAFSYLAAIIGAVTLVVALVVAGLIARRQAAREAAFAVFGSMALIAGLAGLGSFVGGRPSSGSWLGVVTSLVCLAIVVLLALQSTSTDFELAERERRRRAGS